MRNLPARLPSRDHRLTLGPLCLLLLLIVAFATACGPKSEPATGPVGEQVAQAIATGTETFDNSSFSELLAAGVRNGLVDYTYFTRHREQLDAYLESIAQANLASLQGSHLKALLINAYNAYTISSILDHLPIDSIRDIDGVWKTIPHTVGGLELTLDNIEHNILRPIFKDPRVHVAVNCASQSCAPLPNWAFDGDRVEEQLADWTRQFFANPKYLEVREDRLEVSRLLKWYGDDFTLTDAKPRADTLVDFIAERAPTAIQEFIESEGGTPDVEFKDYDWALNEAGQ